MIRLPGTVQVIMATLPVDFRKSMDKLSALILGGGGGGSVLRHDLRVPCKAIGQSKAFVWNGRRVILAAKRLEDGQFCWPKIKDGVVRLTRRPNSQPCG